MATVTINPIDRNYNFTRHGYRNQRRFARRRDRRMRRWYQRSYSSRTGTLARQAYGLAKSLRQDWKLRISSNDGSLTEINPIARANAGLAPSRIGLTDIPEGLGDGNREGDHVRIKHIHIRGAVANIPGTTNFYGNVIVRMMIIRSTEPNENANTLDPLDVLYTPAASYAQFSGTPFHPFLPYKKKESHVVEETREHQFQVLYDRTFAVGQGSTRDDVAVTDGPTDRIQFFNVQLRGDWLVQWTRGNQTATGQDFGDIQAWFFASNDTTTEPVGAVQYHYKVFYTDQ